MVCVCVLFMHDWTGAYGVGVGYMRYPLDRYGRCRRGVSIWEVSVARGMGVHAKRDE